MDSIDMLPSKFKSKENLLDPCHNPSLIFVDLELLIVNIYVPTGLAAERVTFFKSLSITLDQFSDKIIVLIGDFNCVLDTEKDRPHKNDKRSRPSRA